MNICRKAQSTLQYALLVAVVAGVALTMQVYLKRSLMGRIQAAADQMAEQYAFGQTALHDHSQFNSRSAELALPGPWNRTRANANYRSHNTRQLQPLP